MGKIVQKLKKEKISRNYFFLELYVTKFCSHPPLVAKYLPHFVVGYVNNIKKILRFVQLS
jgi:hypothetical protein